MRRQDLILILLAAFIVLGWRSMDSNNNGVQESEPIVVMETNFGTMLLKLSNKTPKHRDNFLKLVNDKAYDSLLFHRVIENFMIQGGDPESRNAKSGQLLGDGDLDYSVPSEFRSDLFHKKGALSTAREDNLDRSSSAMQFFIVQGKVFNDSTLERAENRINNMLARNIVINKDTTLFKAMQEAYEKENIKQLKKLNDSIRALAEELPNIERYEIPEVQRAIYKSVGGTPHLDQNYTVFGELVEGFEVLDAIASVDTDENDRPIKDVRILSVRLK